MGLFVELMVTSKRAQAKRHLPRLLLPVPLFLWWALVYPCFHRRPSNTSRYFGISLLWGYCSFFLSLGAHNVFFFFLVPSKPGVSVFLSPVELWSNPAGLQGQIPWGFPVPLSHPPAGKPDLGFRTFTKWENFFGIIVPNLWVTHLVGMDLILSWLCPSCCLTDISSLSLDIGYHFLVGSSIFLSMVVQ